MKTISAKQLREMVHSENAGISEEQATYVIWRELAGHRLGLTVDLQVELTGNERLAL